VLVRLALGPIESLERVARWISEGRLGERVPASISADHELARLSNTINEMLDSLAAARERMETLGAEVIYAEERGRSQVVRALDDSLGQKLADASFEIAAAANEMKSDARAIRFAKARALLRAATDEIRNLSSSAHLHAVTDLDLARAFGAQGGATRPRSVSQTRSTVDITHRLVPDRRGEPMALEIPDVRLRRADGA
jgi:HAMP domain-containing protein